MAPRDSGGGPGSHAGHGSRRAAPEGLISGVASRHRRGAEILVKNLRATAWAPGMRGEILIENLRPAVQAVVVCQGGAEILRENLVGPGGGGVEILRGNLALTPAIHRRAEAQIPLGGPQL